MDEMQATSVKDYLVKKLAVRLNISQKIIEAVVDHQMMSINKAIQTDNKFTVEISGFGKWIFNHKKALKKYEKQLSKEQVFQNILNKPDLTDKQKASYELKLENTRKWIENMKPKLEKCPSLQNTLS